MLNNIYNKRLWSILSKHLIMNIFKLLIFSFKFRFTCNLKGSLLSEKFKILKIFDS